MSKKPTKNTYAQLEKVFTIAGISLIILGCIANIYGISQNMRFINNNDPLQYVYYARYIFLLGGGFAIGYLLTKKPANKLFGGAFYATLAMTLFTVVDLLRFGLDALFGGLPFPWGKILFLGAPITTILVLLLAAYAMRSKMNGQTIKPFMQWGLIATFVAHQMYMLVSGIYYLAVGSASYPPNLPIWLIAASYLTFPLVIGAASYLLLASVRTWQTRLFYASFTGALYAALLFVLWEFRTDASAESTNMFGSVVATMTLILVGILLWRARKAFPTR